MRHGALFSTTSSNRDDSLGYIHLLESLYKVYDILSGECFYYLSNLIKSYYQGERHANFSGRCCGGGGGRIGAVEDSPMTAELRLARETDDETDERETDEHRDASSKTSSCCSSTIPRPPTVGVAAVMQC